MPEITLSRGWATCPEGTHVFKITGVEYKDTFGKLAITMTTEDGYTHVEHYSFVKSSGAINEGARNAFSFFARIALNDNSIDSIDPQKLIGHFIEADVTHDVVPDKNDPTKTRTFSRLGEKRSSPGFKTSTPEPFSSTPPTSTPSKGLSTSLLDALK